MTVYPTERCCCRKHVQGRRGDSADPAAPSHKSDRSQASQQPGVCLWHRDRRDLQANHDVVIVAVYPMPSLEPRMRSYAPPKVNGVNTLPAKEPRTAYEVKSPRFCPFPMAIPWNGSANVKLRAPAPTGPETDAFSAPLLLKVPLLRVNVNVSVSRASKPRKVGVRKARGHHPAALMSRQVLGGLQQPLLQAQLVPGSLSPSFVHVNLLCREVRSNYGVRSYAVKFIVCRSLGLPHPLVTEHCDR